ncbi:hypothetical protein EBU71_03710 [bacterium]|nr:hypothetical protein [Candidatus Elulimicrobium humile]
MQSKLYLDILFSEQKDILPDIQHISQDFLLVGGTAIALHLGHRQSIDFDFFIDQEFGMDSLKNKLRKNLTFDKILIDKDNEFTFISKGVKITYLYYPFPIRDNLAQAEYRLQLPDLITLLAMKIYALSRRSKWKDYVDIYFGLKHFTLDAIISKAKTIFGNELNEKIIRTQLAYFKDIDYTEEVIYMPRYDISKDIIQKHLTKISLD